MPILQVQYKDWRWCMLPQKTDHAQIFLYFIYCDKKMLFFCISSPNHPAEVCLLLDKK